MLIRIEELEQVTQKKSKRTKQPKTWLLFLQGFSIILSWFLIYSLLALGF